jgi:hypothetical protein
MARCVACYEVLVATDTCKEREDGMKRAMFLATAALLAMLVLAPMALAQGGTTSFNNPCDPGSRLATSGYCNAPGAGYDVITAPTTSASASPFPVPPRSGGPDILLPSAALLLGSGILTYAVLRRR